MKKYIIATIVVLLLIGCAPSAPTPNYSQTAVAETVQAVDTIQSELPPSATPIPTASPEPTSIPTNEPSLIENIGDDIKLLEYCNAEIAQKTIDQFREILKGEQNKEKDKNIKSFDSPMFQSQEEQNKAISETEELIKTIEDIKVPKCLEETKLVMLSAFQVVLDTAKDPKPDGAWIGDIMVAATVMQKAEALMEKIEACLPTGCK